MKTATKVSLTALATSLLSACAVEPTVYGVPYYERTQPNVLSYPNTQSYTTRLAWKGPLGLGNCTGTEVATAAPFGQEAANNAANVLNMDGNTAATFKGLSRSAFTLACGFGSGLDPVTNNQVGAAPAFNNVRIADTGYYLDTAKQAECQARVVMVQPESLLPGQRMPNLLMGPGHIPALNINVPAGWAVPTAPIYYNGGLNANSLLCTHIKTRTSPAL